MTLREIGTNLAKWREGLRDLHRAQGLSMPWLLADSIWCFIVYGCSIRQYTLGNFYRFRAPERRRVLTYRKLFRLIKATNNPSFVKYLEDKELFNTHFAKFISRKWIATSKMDAASFNELCSSETGIIVKPVGGTEGEGIEKISPEELKDPACRDKLFERLKAQDAIVEEVICQHRDMAFGGKSVNTIRVMTLMDKSGNVSVVKALLRAGTGCSAVDNFHQGGCVYEVDLASGRICSLGKSMQRSDIIYHPGTDICMPGYLIPNWKAVLDGCLEAHRLLPQCRYISWDVAVTPSGIEMVEGNHNGDYDMFEFVGTNMYWPVLKQYL